MDRETEQISAGMRFRLNKFGAGRCPSLADMIGTVISCSQSNSGVTVLFDGGKRPTCLHRDYITMLSE